MEGEIYNHSQFFCHSYLGPPPQLPSTRCLSTRSFKLPSYDEAIVAAGYYDSLRLPNYQSRQLRRYHPYWPPYMPSLLQTDDLMYQNTIYDEHFIPLEVPALVGPPRPIPPLVPWGIVPAQQTPEDDSMEESLQGLTAPERAQRSRQIEEERWARAWSLRAVLCWIT